MPGNILRMKLSESELKKAHKMSFRGRAIIEKSKLCGCFYCCRTFSPVAIKEWVDYKDTALCPHCGIDSVLPDIYSVDDKEFLNQMYKYWFRVSASTTFKKTKIVRQSGESEWNSPTKS